MLLLQGKAHCKPQTLTGRQGGAMMVRGKSLKHSLVPSPEEAPGLRIFSVSHAGAIAHPPGPTCLGPYLLEKQYGGPGMIQGEFTGFSGGTLWEFGICHFLPQPILHYSGDGIIFGCRALDRCGNRMGPPSRCDTLPQIKGLIGKG